MTGLKYLIVITRREFTEQYLEFFRSIGLNSVMYKLCNGTATDSVLNYMGLEKTDKIMFETVVNSDKVQEIKDGLIEKLNISAVGNGIAVFMPTGGFLESAKNYFVGKTSTAQKEEEKVEDLSLIITIADKGNSDLIMECSRSAGATGGTVVKAKGTGKEMATLFGISISEEKEMVYIVSKKKDRDVIMQKISEKAGSNTEAHGIIFSIPVESVVGIRGLENL